MENNFVVEVLDTPQDAVALAKKIAPIFKLKEEQAMGLIRRMPGVVTKPASEQNAKLIASRLMQVGLTANVRPATDRKVTKPAAPKPAAATPRDPDGAAATPPAASRPAVPPPQVQTAAPPIATPRPAPTTPPLTSPASIPTERPASIPVERTVTTETGSTRPVADASPASPSLDAGPSAERSTPIPVSPAEPEQRPTSPSPSRPASSAFDPPSTPQVEPVKTPVTPVSTRARSTDPALQEISPEEIAARLTAAQEAKKTLSDSSKKTFPDAVSVDVRQSAITSPSERSQQQATKVVKPARRRRGSLRRKLLWAALIPTLISLIGALAIVWFIARPALYDQLLASAQNPAVATAAGISASLKEQAVGQGGVDVLSLLDTILVAKNAFGQGNISFIVATDTQGNPYASYFADDSSFTVERGVMENNIRQQATMAIASPNATIESLALRTEDATLQIVAQPLIANDSAFGAIVVGVTDKAVSRQVNQIFITMGALSLALFLLALLIAQGVARPLTRNILSLTQAADQISRGDLDTGVTIKSNDELDDLSAALERLRVSMKEAIERLRRRRG